MKKHIIYLATDANRIYVEAGYCQDLVSQPLDILCSNRGLGISTKFNRIVHMEEFSSFETAQRRLIELHNFTRMQKERLIRRYNPNWLNIISPDYVLTSSSMRFTPTLTQVL